MKIKLAHIKMKRIVIFTSLFLMTFAVNEVSAQAWLKKALDKVDQGLNAVDKALGLPVEQPSTTTGYETATVKSFSTNVDFIIESCINDGKTLTIGFYLQNRGSALDVRQFGSVVNPFSDKKDKTRLLDDLGNEYEIVFNAVGKTSVSNSQGINFVLPEGVKLKGEIRVANFNSRAKTLQLANIVGNIYDNTRKNPNNPTSPEYTPFNLVLKNVPVYTSQQVLSASKVDVATAAAAATFTLTAKGVGCLQKGMLVSKIPAKYAGLYDRFEKNLIEDEDEGNSTEYIFYSGTEIVAQANDYGEGKINSITVYSPKVSTLEGVHAGMLIKDFLKIKGAKIISSNYGVYLAINSHTVGYKSEDLTVAGQKAFETAYMKGTDVKFSTAYFKESAKVQYLSF
jgi:hypothetical protein